MSSNVGPKHLKLVPTSWNISSVCIHTACLMMFSEYIPNMLSSIVMHRNCRELDVLINEIVWGGSDCCFPFIAFSHLDSV